MNAQVAYYTMQQWIIDYFEEDRDDAVVVVAGRQPSLHKYNIRGLRPVVLWTKTLELNPMLCKGYNADFDGDQMWVTLLLTPEARSEALEKLSPAVDFINPKNGSIMLEHTQDIALGCYVATMLKENENEYNGTIGDAYYYSSISMLEEDVFNSVIEPYDLVCFNPSIDNSSSCYLSTAGRILFSSLFNDGFTEEPFTNTLGIDGVDVSRFKELKYDGIITSGKAGDGKLRYYNLQDICMERYLEDDVSCIHDYYSIEIFGFKFSDLFSVTISMDDMDVESGKEEILNEAREKKLLIEHDYQNGLISEDDKKDAVVSLYNNDENGALIKIEKNLINNLSRNNNLFIMMDSGARGNKTQIMHMCGAIGILSKTKAENMEDPVVSNYFEGLSDFDVHMTSYSTRMGFISSQMETRNAGYSTRKVVYMTDGISITESDCGKTDWWYDIVWDDIIPEFSVFRPSMSWFKANLLGKELSDCKALKDLGHATVREEDFSYFRDIGFNCVKFLDGSHINAEPAMLKDAKILDSDIKNTKLFKRLIDDGRIGTNCLIVFDHYKVKEIDTSYGSLSCRYKMWSRCRSELMYREARNLEYLRLVISHDTGDRMYTITEKTLDWVEKQGLDRIEARIMLDCECKHGVCAHCYGLRFSNLRIPNIGDAVGTEAAQSIGEPSAQLTLDVVNKGGVAGASIASGIDVFSARLAGTVIGGKKSRVADVPKRSGYARITKIDNNVAVAVEPIDKTCSMCMKCKSRANDLCPMETGSSYDPACLIPNRTPLNMVLVKNGEWVKSGDAVTAYDRVSDNVVSVDDSEDPKILLRHKQMIWIDNYYNTFHDQSVDINVRHFEILALVQNSRVIVTESSNPDFRVGHSYSVSELRGREDIDYVMKTSNLKETILNNSGLLTSLTFAEQPDIVGKATFAGLKNSCKWETSPIGRISVGQHLDTNEVKPLANSQLLVYNGTIQESDEPELDVVEIVAPVMHNLASDDSTAFNLDDIDAIFAEPKAADKMDLFGGADNSSAFSQTEKSSVAWYTVQYSVDGVIIDSITEQRSGSLGDVVMPDETLLPDGVLLFVTDDKIVKYNGQVFVFEYLTTGEDDNRIVESASRIAEDDSVVIPSTAGMNLF